MRDVSKVADERLWQWSRAGYLGKSMEVSVFAVLKSRLCKQGFFRHNWEGRCTSKLYLVCDKEVESVGHFVTWLHWFGAKEHRFEGVLETLLEVWGEMC